MEYEYYVRTPRGGVAHWKLDDRCAFCHLEGNEALSKGIADLVAAADNGTLGNSMPIAVQVSVSPTLVKSIEALKQECDWLRAAKDAAVRDAKAYMNLYIERVAEPPPPPRPSPDKILTVLVVLGAVLILSLPVLEALHVFRF